jgi:hypothetical protein
MSADTQESLRVNRYAAAHMIRQDVGEAIAWLTKAFGFDHLRKSHGLYQYSANSRMGGKRSTKL